MVDENGEVVEEAASVDEPPTRRLAPVVGRSAQSDEILALAEHLGVPPEEAHSAVMTRAANIMTLAQPNDDPSPTELPEARSLAQDLAIYAFEMGLTDDDVANQWCAKAGEAWEFAAQKSADRAARLGEIAKEMVRGLTANILTDNIMGKGALAALGPIKVPAALSKEMRDIATTAARPMIDSLKHLQDVNRDLARHLTVPEWALASPEMDRVLAEAGRASRELREQEQEWRNEVVAGLARLAEVTDTGSQELTALFKTGSKSSRHFAWATLALMGLTLIVTIVIAAVHR